MPDIKGVEETDQFLPVVLETRMDDDVISWTVQVSFMQEQELASCVKRITNLDDSTVTIQVNTVSMWPHLLNCIVGWRGVTQDDAEVPWSPERMLALEGEFRPHLRQLTRAFIMYAAGGEFPEALLGGQEEPEEEVESET